jgi:hypothetical protein
MQWGTLNHWNTNENAIDQAFADAARNVEESLNAPDQWTDYNSTAIADRPDEADAHNAPIREARAARYEEAAAARSEAREREARAREESFNGAVDEIGGALIRGERADIPRGFDKNPLLALFDLYEINVPLRTKGWITRHVRAVQLEEGGILRVWGSAKEISPAFSRAAMDLLQAMSEVTPEHRRAVMGMNLNDIFRNADVPPTDEWQPTAAETVDIQIEASESTSDADGNSVLDAAHIRQPAVSLEEQENKHENAADVFLAAAMKSIESVFADETRSPMERADSISGNVKDLRERGSSFSKEYAARIEEMLGELQRGIPPKIGYRITDDTLGRGGQKTKEGSPLRRSRRFSRST